MPLIECQKETALLLDRDASHAPDGAAAELLRPITDRLKGVVRFSRGLAYLEGDLIELEDLLIDERIDASVLIPWDDVIVADGFSDGFGAPVSLSSTQFECRVERLVDDYHRRSFDSDRHGSLLGYVMYAFFDVAGQFGERHGPGVSLEELSEYQAPLSDDDLLEYESPDDEDGRVTDEQRLNFMRERVEENLDRHGISYDTVRLRAKDGRHVVLGFSMTGSSLDELELQYLGAYDTERDFLESQGPGYVFSLEQFDAMEKEEKLKYWYGRPDLRLVK